MPKEIKALMDSLAGLPCSKRIFHTYEVSFLPLIASLLGLPEGAIDIKIVRSKSEVGKYGKEVVIRIKTKEN